MCFNAQVSLTTYIIGIIGCIVLFIKKQHVIALFFAWIIQMQLVEFLLWSNKSCKKPNKLISKIGAIINHTEPIVLWIAIMLCSKYKLNPVINYFMILFTSLTIIYTKYVTSTLQCTTVTRRSSPHLHWKWNWAKLNTYYYIVFLFAIIILLLNGVDNGIFVTILTIISFAISYVVYNDKHVTGSMWCFAAAFAPWAILSYNQFIKLQIK